jgi:hypothetical protein
MAIAYAAANIASAIPVTPGGLGVIQVTMVAITVGFGTPRATAVLSVLGYRIVNYWLPLLPRYRGLPPAPATVSHGRLTRAPDAAGRVTRSSRLYVH